MTNNLKPLPTMGTFIRNKIEEHRLTFAEVSRRMNIKQPTMNNHFMQDTLQTKTIWNLSQAIEYNLFSDIISWLPEEIQNTNTTPFQKTIVAQQQEIIDLKKEIAIYKDILSKKI